LTTQHIVIKEVLEALLAQAGIAFFIARFAALIRQ